MSCFGASKRSIKNSFVMPKIKNSEVKNLLFFRRLPDSRICRAVEEKAVLFDEGVISVVLTPKEERFVTTSFICIVPPISFEISRRAR